MRGILRSAATALVLAFMLNLTGCNKASNKKTERDPDIQIQEIHNRIETIKKIYHLCPSPVEMLGVISELNLEYDPGILTPLSNAENYQDSRSRAQALGIYLSDLVYAALLGETEEYLDYLELIKQMAEAADLEEVITDELIGNAKDNVEHLDSLRGISTKAFVNLIFYSEKNDNPYSFFLISSGIFVESLFLAVSLVDEYSASQNIISHISGQKYAFDNLLIIGDGLRTSDPNIEAVMQDLQSIREIYEGMDNTTQRFSPAEFLLLKEASLSLRKEIIN